MLAAQVFVLGLCLRRYGDRDWYAPLAVACFGGFGAVVAALLGVEAARGEAADDRFRAATVAVAFCVLPWWGASLRTGGDGGALGTVAVACGALPGLAACADAWASRGAITISCSFIYSSPSSSDTMSPSRISRVIFKNRSNADLDFTFKSFFGLLA